MPAAPPAPLWWRSLAGLGLLFLALLAAHYYADDYQIRILSNAAVFIIMAVSYNLMVGVCGQLHLGPNAFVTIGAYTAALLTLTPAEKTLNFIITPLIWPLDHLCAPFPVALLAGGLMATVFAFLTGFPVLRVRGDYLAIVTLGFGEVVRVVANNWQSLTNGPLGLKGLAPRTTLWWSWGLAVLTVIVILRIIRSRYGRAMQAIREDEYAAQAMGVNPFHFLMIAFLISAFCFGLAGGLLAHLITTISPSLFSFFLTFNILMMIVVGGLGSTGGAVAAALLFTVGGELLRVVEEPFRWGPLHSPGVPGLRMVIFSCLLLAVIIFAPRGLLGRGGFAWPRFLRPRRSSP